MRSNRRILDRLKKGRDSRRRQLFASALEPRVLFSASPVDADPAADYEAPGDESVQSRELDQSDVERLAAEAKKRWAESGLSEEQLEALDEIQLVVVDLGEGILGAAEGNVIMIDDDAAGEGWFVDDTEWEDEEFVFDASGVMRGDSEEIDLLSVLIHETGHVLGLGDEYGMGDESDVMFGLFDQGERRVLAEGRAEGAEALGLEGIFFARRFWDDGAGDDLWGSGGNWNTAPSAAGGDSAMIKGNTGIDAGVSGTAGAATPGAGADGASVIQAGDNIDVSAIYIGTSQGGGVSGSGRLEMTGGQLTIEDFNAAGTGNGQDGNFIIGHNNERTGQFIMSGGQVDVEAGFQTSASNANTIRRNVIVGNNDAEGFVELSGGDFNINEGTFIIGDDKDSEGTVRVSGGTLNTSLSLVVGNKGTGYLEQTGGVINTTGSTFIGSENTVSGGSAGTTLADGGVGEMYLKGGIYNASNNAVVGRYGTGTLEVDGGTLNLLGGSSLVVGANSAGTANIRDDADGNGFLT
ncbi:MAG: LEPR-XLL domain-containing protein, partial [Verrucomicrobiota bacterium]